MTWLALDIGGANLKLANGRDFAQLVAFPLWQSPQLLEEKLQQMLAARKKECGGKKNGVEKNLAITMTGELADCFATRSEGVRFILDAVAAVSNKLQFEQLAVYSLDGKFLNVAQARKQPLQMAASNWHALGCYAAEIAQLSEKKNDEADTALLIDLGSTTCDIIPIQGKRLIHSAMTDTQRMMASELVYTGAQRTPVCAISTTVPYRRQLCPVASEWFATSWDVYLQLGKLPEEPTATNTADSRPATKEHAKHRLARSICLGIDDFSDSDAEKMASYLEHAQASKIAAAILNVIRRMPSPPAKIVTSGIGEFLIHQALQKNEICASLISLNQLLQPQLSVCAAAHALAHLASAQHIASE